MSDINWYKVELIVGSHEEPPSDVFEFLYWLTNSQKKRFDEVMVITMPFHEAFDWPPPPKAPRHSISDQDAV